jgi:hypothetical protein
MSEDLIMNCPYNIGFTQVKIKQGHVICTLYALYCYFDKLCDIQISYLYYSIWGVLTF